MKEKAIMENVLAALQESQYDGENELDIYQVNSFEECGVLSNEKGLVIKMNDGSEYQLFIVQSR